MAGQAGSTVGLKNCTVHLLLGPPGGHCTFRGFGLCVAGKVCCTFETAWKMCGWEGVLTDSSGYRMPCGSCLDHLKIYILSYSLSFSLFSAARCPCCQWTPIRVRVGASSPAPGGPGEQDPNSSMILQLRRLVPLAVLVILSVKPDSAVV